MAQRGRELLGLPEAPPWAPKMRKIQKMPAKREKTYIYIYIFRNLKYFETLEKWVVSLKI